ncbi:Menin isoform 2 [Schistosoma japonicum]|uniref:Menin n=2 Tax=Schistosoma japonicum TaxID=6182 RepID=A0A4Z2CZS5_SCHJA|nr:Menin isoform 2 [Schistosoma japonicum]
MHQRKVQTFRHCAEMTLRAGASNFSVRVWRRYFTLSSIDAVIELMREIFVSCGVVFSDEQTGMTYLKTNTINNSETADVGANPFVKEPNLAFISIVLGYIENHLTFSTSEDFDSIKLKNTLHRKLMSRKKETLTQNYPRSRSPSFTKSQSPLSVHLETPEEQLEASNLELTNKLGSLSRSLPSNGFVQESVHNIHESPVCRRRARRFGSAIRRVRQRNESERSNPTGTIIESPHADTAKDEPLQIITDIPIRKRRRFSDSTIPNSAFPCLTFDEAERLYLDFYNLITTSPKLKPFMMDTSNLANGFEHKMQKSHHSPSVTASTKQYASRALICAICEVLWSQMTPSRVKERLIHTQSVYSFLTTGILDSFGLAYTVVAACQLLGYSDVDLALSEDHGWVEFGPPESRQTADVASWVQESHTSTSLHNSELSSSSHDDLVQQAEHCSRIRKTSSSTDDGFNPPSIRIPPLEHSWLYVSGYPVVCRPRIMAVAAAIAAIQPGASLSAVTQAPTSEPFACGTLSPNPSVSSGSGDLITSTGLVRHLSSASVISMQLVALKHQLLWLCFDAGCLSRYPLGLTNLGDLEDAFPTMGRLASFLNSNPSTTNSKCKHNLTNDDELNITLENLSNCSSISPTTSLPSSITVNSHLKELADSSNPLLPETTSLALALYNRAIVVNQCYYSNYHVYPYTCLAGCLYRHGDNRGALRHWAEASKVIGHYNHTSEDWEIYRELLEIATHLMPQMFRSASENSHFCSEGLVDTDPDGCLYQPDNILDDPHCLSYLLSFYDHLCLWEEGSPVPVLHVGWVDKLMVNLSRFTQRARRHLCLSVASDKEDIKSDINVHSPALTHSTCRSYRWTTESTDTTTTNSETGMVNSSIKRTRRHRSSQIDSISSLSTPTEVIKNDQPKSIINDVINPKVEPTNDDYYSEGAEHSPSSVTNQDAITCKLPEISTKAQNKKSDMVETDSLADKNSKSRTVKPCQTSITVEIPEEISNTNVSIKESYSPNTKSAVSSTHTNSVFDDIQSDVDQIILDNEEQDASPSPLMDFPNHDDLLASLVEACDHRLLNPAFLWGVEPHSPFLPANILPEEALNRLMSVLAENKPASVIMNNSNDMPSTENMIQHIFPTPPNSGSFTGSMENIVHEDSTATAAFCHTPPAASQALENSSIHDVGNSTPISKTEISSDSQQNTVVKNDIDLEISLKTASATKTTEDEEENALFPDGFDTLDGRGVVSTTGDFDLLANLQNELMDSVSSLVVDTNQANHRIHSNSPNIFDLLLESEDNLDKTLCHQHETQSLEEHKVSTDSTPINSDNNNNNSNDNNNSLVNQSTNRPVKTMEELTVHLSLYSVKMASIIELLRAPRLNSSAIKLALTAQSQVCVRRSSNVHSNCF